MGIKRRAFLIGGVAIVGGGVFGIKYADSAAASAAMKLTARGSGHTFSPWLKIAADDTVTLFSPHADVGQGSNTGLAQMLADELDADWGNVTVVSAPGEPGFANSEVGRGFLGDLSGYPGIADAMPTSVISFLARSMNLQITGGSSSLRYTGQHLMQKVGAATRLALIAEAAERLGVPADELATQDSTVIHQKSSRSLRYGQLAEAAAARSFDSDPVLKEATAYRLIGQPIQRLDIPEKVDGSLKFGMDVILPDMRVATVMASPVRGGKLISVDPAPAMAVKGVEKVIKLDSVVVVVAKGYWAAITGLRALSPKFSDGGNAGQSTASIFAAHAALIKGGDASSTAGSGEVDEPIKAAGAKAVTADFKLPFLHHAMMEPFALTAHKRGDRLDIWGGMQDPLGTKMAAVGFSGLPADNVTFHPMTLGGSFGRRLPMYVEIVEQVTRVAMQLPYPVKLIWSREEEVAQGAYRPQSSARLRGAVGSDGKITAWVNDYAQPESAETETKFIYDIPAVSRRYYEHKTNQTAGAWRSVNSTQQGFYNETFIDELALAAGKDPVAFRLAHLPADGRHAAVLSEVAKRSGWGAPLPKGVGRGVAIVESFKTIAAHVIEASVGEDGLPKVHRVFSVVDCGRVVNPLNAENQIQGGIVMGLSAAIGEAITLEKGAVVQQNFGDYPLLKLAASPASIDVHFVNSGAVMGGIGEPGLPPAAPALANALFAATGKRVRTLPIMGQAV